MDGGAERKQNPQEGMLELGAPRAIYCCSCPIIWPMLYIPMLPQIYHLEEV